MRVHVVVVGKVRSPLQEAVSEYEARAARYWKFSVTEVDAGSRGKGGREDPAAIRAAEGERLRTALAAAGRVVALTREGRAMSSPELARFMDECALGSVREVAFVVGGAFGLDPEIVRAAHRRVSLSGLTLPHEMARLVLAEQLYRAGTISRGEPYHKGGGGR
jgi:23S rRNA (pseudouridine1915-N3)-methyltransferase